MQNVWMQLRMLRTSKNLKVLNRVVCFVFILVMNNFMIGELPANVLLHDVSMFKYADSVNANELVPVKEGSRSSRSNKRDGRVSVPSGSGIVLQTKAIAVDSGIALRDGTDVWLDVFNESAVARIFNHSVHGSSFTAINIPLPRMDVKGSDRAKRMNSVEALTGYAEGNTEPSQKYTSGRCNDYRRGTAPLMTGQSVRPERDDIVYSL